MAGQEIFLEYRSEFHDLFVDVEDEISALVEQLEAGFAPATPGPDVITALRRCFAEANYDHGPVRPVSLVRAVCREESIEALLREAGGSQPDLMVELSAFEDETVIVFRGWLPRLFRQYWNRQRWTRELAQLLAHAAIEGALRHRSSFSCADVLLAVWAVEPIIRGALERSGVTRIKARSFLAHGVGMYPPAPEEPGPPGLVNVRVQYDVYSSFLQIEQILRSTFDVAEPEEHLQRLYNVGFAMVGPFESADALSRIQRARTLAAAEDAPLRLNVEPLPADGAIVPGAPEW